MLTRPEAPGAVRRPVRDRGTVLSQRRRPRAGTHRVRRPVRDRGTVLLLFPAAVFVVLVLAAITLDVGFTHVRAQQLRSVAASAANDALGSLDADALRSTGTISFDGAEAERLVRAAVAQGPIPEAEVAAVVITHPAADRWEIAVTLSVDVRFMIAPAIPGAARGVRVTTTERALAVVGTG